MGRSASNPQNPKLLGPQSPSLLGWDGFVGKTNLLLFFGDLELEMAYRGAWFIERKWKCMAAVVLGFVWSIFRVAMGGLSFIIGKNEYLKCCISIWNPFTIPSDQWAVGIVILVCLETGYTITGMAFLSPAGLKFIEWLFPWLCKPRFRLSKQQKMGYIGDAWLWGATFFVTLIPLQPQFLTWDLHHDQLGYVAWLLGSYGFMMQFRMAQMLCWYGTVLSFTVLHYAIAGRDCERLHLAVLFVLVCAGCCMLSAFRRELHDRRKFLASLCLDRDKGRLEQVVAMLVPGNALRAVVSQVENEELGHWVRTYDDAVVVAVGLNAHLLCEEPAEIAQRINRAFKSVQTMLIGISAEFGVQVHYAGSLGDTCLAFCGGTNDTVHHTGVIVEVASRLQIGLSKLGFCSCFGIHCGNLLATVFHGQNPRYYVCGGAAEVAMAIRWQQPSGVFVSDVTRIVLCHTRESMEPATGECPQTHNFEKQYAVFRQFQLWRLAATRQPAHAPRVDISNHICNISFETDTASSSHGEEEQCIILSCFRMSGSNFQRHSTLVAYENLEVANMQSFDDGHELRHPTSIPSDIARTPSAQKQLEWWRQQAQDEWMPDRFNDTFKVATRLGYSKWSLRFEDPLLEESFGTCFFQHYHRPRLIAVTGMLLFCVVGVSVDVFRVSLEHRETELAFVLVGAMTGLMGLILSLLLVLENRGYGYRNLPQGRHFVLGLVVLSAYTFLMCFYVPTLIVESREDVVDSIWISFFSSGDFIILVYFEVFLIMMMPFGSTVKLFVPAIFLHFALTYYFRFAMGPEFWPLKVCFAKHPEDDIGNQSRQVSTVLMPSILVLYIAYETQSALKRHLVDQARYRKFQRFRSKVVSSLHPWPVTEDFRQRTGLPQDSTDHGLGENKPGSCTLGLVNGAVNSTQESAQHTDLDEGVCDSTELGALPSEDSTVPDSSENLIAIDSVLVMFGVLEGIDELIEGSNRQAVVSMLEEISSSMSQLCDDFEIVRVDFHVSTLWWSSKIDAVIDTAAAHRMVRAGLRMQKIVAERCSRRFPNHEICLKVGLHCGSALGLLLVQHEGTDSVLTRYHLVGRTVNIARSCACAAPSEGMLSTKTVELLLTDEPISQARNSDPSTSKKNSSPLPMRMGAIARRLFKGTKSSSSETKDFQLEACVEIQTEPDEKSFHSRLSSSASQVSSNAKVIAAYDIRMHQPDENVSAGLYHHAFEAKPGDYKPTSGQDVLPLILLRAR